MGDEGDYFSLKWSNFRSSLTEGFHDFLQEEAMVDVTLAAEGKFVQAHKLVLSVCSPYFKNLFKVNPCKHPIVFLKDVGLNDLSYMLEFMYKGEVGVKHEDLPSFLKLADTLKVKGLAGDKIQNDENCSSNDLDSNIARIRNKVNQDSVLDMNKENSEVQSCSEKKIRKRKKFSCKPKLVKKLKREKCVDESAEKNSGDVSEDEDNNPLIKFVRGDSVKSGGSSKQSGDQCDNENESQCDNNKTNYSVWSDDIPDSDESGGPDINSLFQSDYSEEAEQAPQDVFLNQTALRFSPVWNYYEKVQNNMAVCKMCRKTLKGAQTTQAEYHLRAKHPPEAAAFLKQKADWLEKKEKMSSVCNRWSRKHVIDPIPGLNFVNVGGRPRFELSFEGSRDRRFAGDAE